MPIETTRLAIPIPALGELEWRGTYVAAFELIDDLLGRIIDAGGLTFVRRYDGASWPDRGDLPTGASVLWVKPDPSDPNPATGGNGMDADLDLVVAAVT